MRAFGTTCERAGRSVVVQAGSDGYSAFVPAPLPPDPPVVIDARTLSLLDEANQALGRLDSVTLLLPDPDQFLYSYIRKEAVLSVRPAALRERGRPWGAARRRRGDLELHRGHEPRTATHPVRRTAAQQ